MSGKKVSFTGQSVIPFAQTVFNRLPKSISMLSSCSVVGFKSRLDSYLRNIVDLPCRPGFNNSLDGGDCLHGGHYVDDLVAN